MKTGSDMDQKQGWGYVLQQLEKKPGGEVFDMDGWIEDERVTCSSCQHMVQAVQTINMPADQFDKVRRQNHPANQWMFDIVKIKNGWARVEYIGWKCNGGEPSYIPVDVMHRCHCYKPKVNAQAFNVKEWWE